MRHTRRVRRLSELIAGGKGRSQAVARNEARRYARKHGVAAAAADGASLVGLEGPGKEAPIQRRRVSSEVIVTLFPQHFVRFVSDLGAAADDVFGGDPHWRTVTDLAPEAKSRHILTCYRTALRSAGFPYLLDFELIPRKGQPLYLVFGTRHRLGVSKMKDSLWEVDRTQGVGFRDPRDEQAETLFNVDQPQLGPLTRLLEQRLRDKKRELVEHLRDFALFETVYRPEHVIRALKPLVDHGVLTVEGGGALRKAAFVSLVSATTR